MNVINNLLASLAGYDPAVVALATPYMRFRYRGIGFILLFIFCLAFAGGFEIAIQVTDVLLFRFAFAFLYASLIFTFDYFLVLYLQGSSHIVIVFRIFISILLSSIVAMPFPIMLAHKKVNAELHRIKLQELSADDSIHFSKVALLKQPVQKLEDSLVASQKSYVHEGLTGHKTKYEDKVDSYKKDSVRYTSARHELDSTLAVVNADYAKQKNMKENENSDDYISKVECILRLSLRYPLIGFFIFAILIVLVSMETCLIFFKQSLDTVDDEYKRLQKQVKDKKKIVTDVLLNQRTSEEMNNIEIMKMDADGNFLVSKFAAFKKDFHNVIVFETFTKKLRDGLKEAGYSISEEFVTDFLKTLWKDKKYVDDIFMITAPMKELVANLKNSSVSGNILFDLYTWAVTNIEYDINHSKQFYRTARECFNSRLGLCGETSLCLIVLYKEAGIDANFCEVTIDDAGKQVTHACVAVKRADGYQLIDVAYRNFDINHKQYAIWSTEELGSKYMSWNQ